MTVSLPKAVLIDLDDTIISFDQGVDLKQCWLRAIRACLPSVRDDATKKLAADIMARADWYWSDPERHRIGRRDLVSARQAFVSEALRAWGIPDPALARSLAVAYGEERDRQVKLFPGALEAIELFRTRGIKLALITNGSADTQWAKIRRFNLSGLFDAILIEGEVGVGKPEAGIYRLALERLGATAEETWMIGDNFEWEIVAPQRLGIKGIWLDHAGAGVPDNAPSRPYRVIRSWGELLDAMWTE